MGTSFRRLAHLCLPCVVVLGCCMAAASPAAAGGLTGSVMDEHGQPLPGASVTLRDAASGQQRYGTITGNDGTFRIPAVQPGRYDLLVSFVGYTGYRKELAMGAADERIRVQLSPFTVEQPDVIMTATRARSQLTPITFSNLSARELQDLADMKDLPVLLSTLPSVTYHSENGNGIGYSTLRMRGFDQHRVAVSINGIPQNDPEDFDVYWINFFDVQGAIQDIQVQRGAGASFYGPDAIGGAINIVAVPYKPNPYATVEVGYGSYDTRRYTAEVNSGLLKKHYVVFGRYSRLLSDGYRDWSWTSFNRFFAGIARYGKHSTLTVQAFGGPQHDGLAYVGIPRSANEDPQARRANYSSLTHDVEYFHQPHAEVLHDWSITPNWALKQALFWMQGKGYFDFGGTFRSPNYLRLPPGWRGLTELQRAQPLYVVAPDVNVLFRAYVGQWQVGWIPRITYRHGTSETTIGTEMRLHRSVRWGRIQDATSVPPELIGSENDARVYQYHGEKVIGSIFASELFRPLERMAVQADLQLTYRRYRQYDEAFFGTRFAVPYVFANPRLGITVNPERPVSGYVSIAIANREPVLKSLYDGEEAGAGFRPQFAKDATGQFDFDRPFVKPEHLVDVEAGASLSRTTYRLSGNVFWMSFHDEIVPSGGLDQFGVARTGNADRTRHIGLELEGFVRPLPGLDARANLTLSRNRFIHFVEYVSDPDGNTVPAVRDDNPIAGFPEQVANVSFSYTRAGATLSLDGKYAGRQYIDNSGGIGSDGTPDSNLSVDPYVLLNASVRYTFSRQTALRGIELAFDLNNVLDQKVLLYGDVGAAGPQFFPTATRHVFASIRYTVR